MSVASRHASAAAIVIGTTVRDASGARIGEIADVLLDRGYNKILFAIIACCGSPGVAGRRHSVPWCTLRYDEVQQAYVAGSPQEPG
jgi:PRC-barrel domain